MYVNTDTPLVSQSCDSSKVVSSMVSITYDQGQAFVLFSNFEGFNIFGGTVNFRAKNPGVIQLRKGF